MLKSKYIERICCIVIVLSMLLTCGVIGAVQSGAIEISTTMGYENRLFDQSRVHTVDIVMDDWAGFIDSCENEEYVTVTLVIDGEVYRNVAIRAKGNTSLSSVAAAGNDRYSFKVEFDHYDASITYHGLDKLSLNNLIQDATRMKDYLAYTLMNRMGVAAPLCAYVQISVNGEPWGLYLAVEGVEDGFLARNYGSDTGELYKPDSLSFGGGRGNGRDFDMADFDFGFDGDGSFSVPEAPDSMDFSRMAPGDASMPDVGRAPATGTPGQPGEVPVDRGGRTERGGFGGGVGGGFGMGSSDVKLQYTDDDPASYSNIFNNAKTDITSADQTRLITSLRLLSEGDISVVDTDQVMRYLAVHHFLCNDDSYTGQMVHNYYLREDDGVLSLIPWDYNLAFGGFSGGMGGATNTVNSPIDSPVSSGDASDRPLIGWIWENEETTAAYHAIYQEFLDTVFNSGWFAGELERVISMLAPYVQADENGFYTYEEFLTATETLRAFCEKRVQSLNGQLAGTIPSTSAGQRNSDALIDGSDIRLADMGSMSGMGGGGGFGGGMPDGGDFRLPEGMELPGGITFPNGFEAPGSAAFPVGTADSAGASATPAPAATSAPATPQGMPGNAAMPPDGMSMPEGFEMPGTGGMPGGNAFSGSVPGGMASPDASSAPSVSGDTNSEPADIGSSFLSAEHPRSIPRAAAQTSATSVWPWLLGCAVLLAMGISVAALWKGNM